MQARLITLMLCLTAMSAAAEVFKCKQPSGAVAYQETPCAQDATGTKMELKVPGVQPLPPERNAGDQRAMKDAYESRMARQDYEGASAFATTDKERHRAHKLAAEKRLKCGGLAIRAQQAQANVKPGKESTLNAAIAAEREYNLRCR